MQTIQTREIEIASVHHIDRTGFQRQRVEPACVGHPPILTVGEMNEARDIATQLKQRVQFDRCLCGLRAAKVYPRPWRQTQIDGAGIKRIDATGQIGAEGLVPIRELREGHDAKLLGVGEVLDVVVTLVTGTDSMQALLRQEVHDLCEERLVEVHALLHE